MRKRYALVNLGNGEGWICMSFENNKEMLSFCQSYHYQPIPAKETKKHTIIKHVRSFGDGIERNWKW